MCDNIYAPCDGYWPCRDGRDENNCRHTKWPLKSHACIDDFNYTVVCLSVDRVNNVIDDCLGASDEEHTCQRDYPPTEVPQRFRCSDDDAWLLSRGKRQSVSFWVIMSSEDLFELRWVRVTSWFKSVFSPLLQDHPSCPSTIICLSRKYFFESTCQFYAKGLGMTFDEILGYELKQHPKLCEQAITVKVSAVIPMLMCVIDMISGILSIMLFQRQKAR